MLNRSTELLLSKVTLPQGLDHAGVKNVTDSSVVICNPTYTSQLVFVHRCTRRVKETY